MENDEALWLIVILLAVIAYLLERLEKRLVQILRFLKFGSDD